ncbi:MAG: S9 family peptidase, partial [Pedobacter sp.]
MNFRNIFFKLALLLVTGFFGQAGAQEIKWASDGNSYYQISSGELVSISLPSNEQRNVVDRNALYSAGNNAGLSSIKDFQISEDG